METLIRAIELRQQDIAGLPEHVQVWLIVMRSVFFVGIVFVYWRIEARFVLGTLILTGALLIIGKMGAPTVHTTPVGTTIHIILWLPLLIYLVSRRRQLMDYFREGPWFSTFYGCWLIAAMITLSISLFFDIPRFVMLLAA